MPTINRETVISFPLNNNRADITTGIEAGSLYLNRVLFQKQLNPGEANSDRFEATLFDCADISEETIYVYQVDFTDEENPVNIPLFYGVIDSCLKEDNGVNRKVVAYDLMYTIGNTDVTSWWNNYWNNNVNSTVGDLFESLLTTFNVTLDPNSEILVQSIDTYDLSIMQFNGVQAITFGTVLSYICQILMCNPHFNAYGELVLIYLGATGFSSRDIRNGYEDANSHFEDYITPAVSRVVIYGETDVIAGSYGNGDNVYVIKGNPLLYNLSESTYTDLAEFFYDKLSNHNDYYVCYRPANIKMIVSDTYLEFGDMVRTQYGFSFVSAMELSGPMLVEQTIISSGNQKLTPDDFNLNSANVANVTEIATTTSRHFVWVPNDGAYVTTDNTPAGQAPTQNYSKLTEDGLYVAVEGKEVAHFGVDTNDNPIAILGDQTANGTSVTMSNTGIVASKQKNSSTNIEYLSLNVAPDVNYDLNYQATIGNSVSTNEGVRSIVLGDGNTVTSDSETGVFVAGHNNSIDNNRALDNYSGTCVLGRNNTVEGKVSFVAGNGNHIYDTNGYGTNNYIIGAGNALTSSGYGAQYNSILGRGNTITGDSMESVVLGKNNDVVGSNNCLLGYELKDGANTLNNIIVGQYNVAPTTSGNFIVGNGSSDNQRSNAMKVDDSGNTTIAGNLYFNGGSSSLSTQLSNKQNTLTAGTNISISNNVISATDTKPSNWHGTTETDRTGTDWASVPTTQDIELPNNSAKSVGTFQLTAGVWIVEVAVSFNSNANGRRVMGISGTKDASDFGGTINRVSTRAVDGDYTVLSKTVLLYPSTTTRYHVVAFQNRGGSLFVYPRYRAIKIL